MRFNPNLNTGINRPHSNSNDLQFTLNPYCKNNFNQSSLLRNNSAHIILKPENKLPNIHQTLRRSEIDPDFINNKNKGKV